MISQLGFVFFPLVYVYSLMEEKYKWKFLLPYFCFNPIGLHTYFYYK